MDKREIVLFGFGFLVGYIVIRATGNNNIVVPKNQTFPDTSAESELPKMVGAVAGSTQIQEPEVVETAEDPKISGCKDKWIKYAETIKFGSQEQMQKTYDNFMTSCVAQS